MACRICLEEENTKSLCGCRGTQGFAHVECVQRWVRESGREECEICHQPWSKEIRIPIIREKNAPIILVLGCILNIMYAYLLWFETCVWANESSIFIIIASTIIVNSITISMWQCYYYPYGLLYTYMISWCCEFVVVSGLLEGFCLDSNLNELYFPWGVSIFVHVCLLTHSIFKRHTSEREMNTEPITTLTETP